MAEVAHATNPRFRGPRAAGKIICLNCKLKLRAYMQNSILRRFHDCSLWEYIIYIYIYSIQ